MSIHDASGQVIRVIDLDGQSAGPLTLKWDGKTSDGAQAVDGVYSISVQCLRGDQKVEAQTLSLVLFRASLKAIKAFVLTSGHWDGGFSRC